MSSGEPSQSRNHASEELTSADGAGALEEILQATNAADRSLSPSEHAAVEAIAQKYLGQEFCCQPILVELVDAFLKARLRQEMSAECWQAMCQEVADVMFQTPETQDRLRSFWQRLCETVS
ncbi:MAG: hypothetical protein R3C28_13995 [Pirellulaceae bacterium]